jgi:hypothetical protein
MKCGNGVDCLADPGRPCVEIRETIIRTYRLEEIAEDVFDSRLRVVRAE